MPSGTIRRLLGGLLAVIFGWLAAPTPAATPAPEHLFVAYTYDVPNYDGPMTHATLERGPPVESLGYTIPAGVDRWSHGASARPKRVESGPTITYTARETPAQVATATTHPGGVVEVTDGGLSSLPPAGVAAEAGDGETTTLWRAVGQNEADDIAATGGYRNAPGLEGKYFFRTREQAEQYGQMMNKHPAFGAPNYLTSGSVPTSALGSAEAMEAGTEGPGLFFRGDLNDFFDVIVHGLIP